MTNQIAIGLGMLILLALGLDAIFFGWDNSIFLAKKFWNLMDYVAFWR